MFVSCHIRNENIIFGGIAEKCSPEHDKGQFLANGKNENFHEHSTHKSTWKPANKSLNKNINIKHIVSPKKKSIKRPLG